MTVKRRSTVNDDYHILSFAYTSDNCYIGDKNIQFAKLRSYSPHHSRSRRDTCNTM